MIEREQHQFDVSLLNFCLWHTSSSTMTSSNPPNNLLLTGTSPTGATVTKHQFQEYVEEHRLKDLDEEEEELAYTATGDQASTGPLGSSSRTGAIHATTRSTAASNSPSFDNTATDFTFLSECLYGIVDRYKTSLIDPIINLYYSFNKQLASSDRVLYDIFLYLSVMRLKELKLKHLRLLIQCSPLTTSKTVDFFNFLYDEENIQSFFVPEWKKSFDHEWVEEELVNTLHAYRDSVQKWIGKLEEKVNGTQELKEEDLPQVTIPEPFDLTQPKVKIIPQPKVLDTTFKARDVPSSTYECEPEIQRALAHVKEGKKNVPLLPEEQRLEYRETFQKSIQGPHFENLNKRAEKRAKRTAQKRKAELKEQIRQDMKQRRPKGKSLEEVRKMMNQAAKVKYNTAAMLREDALFKQKQEKEAAVLKKYETELRDASEFHEWQEEMRRKDELENQLRLEERKLEMELTDARAKQARLDQEERNRLEAAQLKDQTEKQLEKLKEEQELEQQQLREQANQLQEEIREAVKKAKTKDKKEKEQLADQIRRQKHKQELILARQLELERQRKEDLVMQVKAQESVKAASEPKFDPTETNGDGLLNEMSFVEMKNRLELQRKQEEKLLRQKQEQIEKRREKKRQELVEKSKRISEYRRMASAESKKRKVERLRQEYKERAKMQKERDAKLLELQKRIQEHRDKQQQEREQRKEEERQRKMKAKFMGAAKRDRELKHWKQQEEGRNREAFQKARDAKVNFERQQEARNKDQSIVMRNKRRQRETVQKTRRQVEDTIREKHKLNQTQREEEDVKLKQNARMQREYESGMREEIQMRKNPMGYGGVAGA